LAACEIVTLPIDAIVEVVNQFTSTHGDFGSKYLAAKGIVYRNCCLRALIVGRR
jgi:hypothetical protein